MLESAFIAAMKTCTERVRHMEVRFVQVLDNITQHLFEVYCALALQTPYNEFKTT
jgi:hypothetical protein